MGYDDRIRFLAREEVKLWFETLSEPLTPGELGESPGWAERLDDLHQELHALATKVAALEQRVSALDGPTVPRAVAAPTRARRTSDNTKGSA